MRWRECFASESTASFALFAKQARLSLITWTRICAICAARESRWTSNGQRKGLGYSKDLETHKLAVALHFGIYNFVRKHATLGTTPAVAAGIELERWSLEQAVEMTEAYLRRKEDEKFEAAFAASNF